MLLARKKISPKIFGQAGYEIPEEGLLNKNEKCRCLKYLVKQMCRKKKDNSILRHSCILYLRAGSKFTYTFGMTFERRQKKPLFLMMDRKKLGRKGLTPIFFWHFLWILLRLTCYNKRSHQKHIMFLVFYQTNCRNIRNRTVGRTKNPGMTLKKTVTKEVA